MDHSGSGASVLARFASPLVNGVKRVFSEFGLFVDSGAYQDEIARYEGEIRQNGGPEVGSSDDVESGTREPATS